MRFKRNITITLACVITECLISLIPSICMIYIFFIRDRIKEMLFTVLVVPYFILIINAILIIISLIAQIFMKTRYQINRESLVVETKNEVKEIRYEIIESIIYDFGDLTKFHTNPSQLVLFDKDCKPLLSINNPSIIMVYKIRNKCKNRKIAYYNNKRFLYLLLLINSIVLLSLFLIKLFS